MAQTIQKFIAEIDFVKTNSLGLPRHPRLIVCGGDGSYMKVLKCLTDSGVDPNFVVACFLPFGTGNDLPNGLGWGQTPI